MRFTWLMPCLLAIALAAAVLAVTGVEAGTVVVAAAAIACPLMMLLMMGGGIHRFAHRDRGGHEPTDTSPAKDATPRS